MSETDIFVELCHVAKKEIVSLTPLILLRGWSECTIVTFCSEKGVYRYYTFEERLFICMVLDDEGILLKYMYSKGRASWMKKQFIGHAKTCVPKCLGKYCFF